MGACTSTAKWEDMPSGNWPQKNEGVVIRLAFHYDPLRHAAPFAECLVHKVSATTGINKLDVTRSDYMHLMDHKLVAAPAFLNSVGSLPFAVVTGMSGFTLEDFSPSQLDCLKSIDVSNDFWKQLDPDMLSVEDAVYRTPQLKAQSIAFAEDEWNAWVRTHWSILDELNTAQKKGKDPPDSLNATRKQDKIQGEPLIRLDAVKTTKALSTEEFHKNRDLTLSGGSAFRTQLKDRDVTLRLSATHQMTGFRPFHTRLESTSTKANTQAIVDAREYIFLWSDAQGKTKTGPHDIPYPEKFELKAEGLDKYAEALFKNFLKHTAAKLLEKSYPTTGDHAVVIDADALSVGLSAIKQTAIFKAPPVKQEVKGDDVDEKRQSDNWAKDDNSLRLRHFLSEVGHVTTADEFRDNQMINIQVGQMLHPSSTLDVQASEEERDVYNIQSPVHSHVPARLTITAETRVRSGSSKSTTPTHTQIGADGLPKPHAHVGDVFGNGGTHSRHGSGSRPPSAPSSGRSRGPSAFTFDNAGNNVAAASSHPPAIESVAEHPTGGAKRDSEAEMV